MNAHSGTISILAAPFADPGTGRIDMHMPVGSTVAAIVEAALPGATARDLDYCRVALVSDLGSIIVTRQSWHRVKPRAGVRVVVRIIPGKDALKSILQIVVSVAAIALGQFWAPALVSTLGISSQLASGLIGLGVTVLGNLLINALIPPPKVESQEQKAIFSISGWKNPLTPNGVVPDILGRLRYAPPFGAMSYTEIVGDQQYVRAVFNFGYGPLALDDFRLGDTSLAEYDEVEIEVRQGLPGDLPIALYPRQIVEETIGAELSRPYPRDDLGEIINDSDPLEKPVVRTTGADAKGASIIVGFPAGACKLDKKGKKKSISIGIRIQQRLAGATEWQLVDTLSVSARKLEGFFRQYTWDFPVRGRYEIQLTRMRPEDTDAQVQSRTSWVALQTLRPEYPFAFSKPMALVGLRIKATYQLQGALDTFNAIASRICPDWDQATGTWITRETRNPASLFRHVLQSKANARPALDSGIDLDQLISWHRYCTLKGLKFDKVIDYSAKLREVLAEVASAGRASPRHDGIKWGVVVDRPKDLAVTDHVNPRNSYQFASSRSYIDPPHGFRVPFLDATNDYLPAERLVPWPGYAGPVTLTEQLDLPGKTDPSEVWKEARRRMYELLHRPDSYTVIQDGAARVATRGDLVMGSFDTLERTQVAARVKSVNGNLLELDELVTMVAGTNYAIRFRHYASNSDQVGSSVVRPVATVAGEFAAVRLTGSGLAAPIAGELVHFGIALQESLPLIVTGIEAGEDFAGVYRMVDAAPIIDDLTDAEVPPAWSGRIGTEIDQSLLVPLTPRFTSISSGLSGADAANAISILIEPGTGSVPSSKFTIEHRISGAWTSVTIPAGNGGLVISSYAKGNVVQLRAFALSASGRPSPTSATVSITVGAGDAAIPTALNSPDIAVAALLGGAVITGSTTDDPNTAQVQVYRSTSPTLNTATDRVGEPYAVTPSRSFSLPLGDATRSNLIINGAFAAGTWTLGTWTIGSGVASHPAGVADAISQALMGVATGKFVRIYFKVTASTAGTVRPRISGGSNRDGVIRTAVGSYSDRVQTVTGNNVIGMLASADFAGSIDDFGAYVETATCLAQGLHYIWLEPQNADGVPGPIAGPFTVTIS
ncbi:host specificity protein J [Pararhizobium sp.]|uniref:host specificity protein J n=1 Tax=Pararhizobium sp. TaxID=1977563 RepID=UPI003D0F38D5